MTGHKVLSKPVIEGVSVIDGERRNMHRKVLEAIHTKFEEPPSTEQDRRVQPTWPLPTLAEREGDLEGQERLTGYTFTADTTSGTAVLPVEAKLLVGEMVEVNSFSLHFKVSVQRIGKTLMIT